LIGLRLPVAYSTHPKLDELPSVLPLIDPFGEAPRFIGNLHSGLCCEPSLLRGVCFGEVVRPHLMGKKGFVRG